MNITRCKWVPLDKPDYVAYHDNEWGIPIYQDHKHFEMLCLEGAQAGLSWYTILKRRHGYRVAFKNFDPNLVAIMTDSELECLLTNTEIIRNRLKVFAARQNAKVFLNIQQEFGSFSDYIWKFVDNKPIINRPKTLQELQPRSKESDLLSADLKKRGMNFIGSTIIYAHMQATDLVNDHMECCFKRKQIIS